MFITREELALRRIVFDKTYPPEQFRFTEQAMSAASPVQAKGAAELVGADVRVHGRVTARVSAACDCCTTPVELPIEQDFDLLYRPVSSIAAEEEIEVPPDELDVGFYTGNGIDLADVVKEQLILALPMKVVCRPDCCGLCAVCGADLNAGPCGCHETKDESPFASLLRNV
ncbi:MAG: DUF177 domain-containing protein [Acidobacteriota bacterium]|nr:DUF177 domain-containing protein [Acidobacteriota bacterium]